MATFEEPGREVLRATFTPDGRNVLVTSRDSEESLLQVHSVDGFHTAPLFRADSLCSRVFVSQDGRFVLGPRRSKKGQSLLLQVAAYEGD